MAGWIKIHRSLLDWEWYDDDKTVKLLIHLNLKVNYKDKKWKGKIIKAGSFVTSVVKLSTELKTTPKTIRVHLKRLVESGEIEVITTNKNTSITLVKWEQMQKDDDSRANELPIKLPNKLPIKLPTTKEGKENKEREEIEIYPSFSDFWDLYDKKTDKPKSLAKWNKLTQAVKLQIIDYLPRYKLSQPDKQYRKNPVTFLNNESWNNELIINKQTQDHEKQQSIADFTKAIRNGEGIKRLANN